MLGNYFRLGCFFFEDGRFVSCLVLFFFRDGDRGMVWRSESGIDGVVFRLLFL